MTKPQALNALMKAVKDGASETATHRLLEAAHLAGASTRETDKAQRLGKAWALRMP